MVPFGVADDLMTLPKVRADWTINVSHMLTILVVLVSAIVAYTDIQRTQAEHSRDIEALKSDSRLLSPRLAVIETQMSYTVGALERIDRRTEARER